MDYDIIFNRYIMSIIIKIKRNKLVKIIMDIVRGRFPISRKHKLYGKIFYPYYNLSHSMPDKDYDLYDKNGNKLDVYFIRDIHMAHEPARMSDYFLFDRYNYGLKTHFYSHNSMLQTMGNPDKRYGFLIESESLLPEDYKIFDKHKTLNQDFDLIFTYSADILEKVDNARFVPFYGDLYNSKLADEDVHRKKNKNISILSSNKLSCDLHKYRFDLAWLCKNEKLADTYGTFDNGPLVKIQDTLENYRYTICIENDIKPYFFTQKLICAFANQTIPVYLGATEIDKFFNPDGIIKITTKSDIREVLKSCTEEEYQKRLPAILDNYERAKEYKNPWNYIYEKYLKS